MHYKHYRYQNYNIAVELNEKWFEAPIKGVPMRENNNLRYVDISVVVPTVEREFPENRFCPIKIAGDRFSIRS